MLVKKILSQKCFPQGSTSKAYIKQLPRCLLFLEKLQEFGLLTVNEGKETVTLLRKEDELTEDVMNTIRNLQEKHPDFSLV